jgi:osmotically inducible protein OsmC
LQGEFFLPLPLGDQSRKESSNQSQIKKTNIMKRRATAVWQGNGAEGKGTLNSVSGVLKDTPYSSLTRFKNEDGLAGTNPEELIAAAHSGCFSMALSYALTAAGFTVTELKVEAAVNIEHLVDHFAITGIHLNLEGKVPGITAEKFTELAGAAKINCPVSQALKAVEITLSAKLV